MTYCDCKQHKFKTTDGHCPNCPNHTPNEKTVETQIETIRLGMRIGCDCRSCRDNNENIGSDCVIRKALTSLHQSALEEKKKLVKWLVALPKTTGRDIVNNDYFENETFRNGYIRANTDFLKALAERHNINIKEI